MRGLYSPKGSQFRAINFSFSYPGVVCRFEWTRQEFLDWATDLATLYGYSVEFTGAGNTLVEEECDDVGGDVGCATQVAVFRKQQAL